MTMLSHLQGLRPSSPLEIPPSSTHSTSANYHVSQAESHHTRQPASQLTSDDANRSTQSTGHHTSQPSQAIMQAHSLQDYEDGLVHDLENLHDESKQCHIKPDALTEIHALIEFISGILWNITLIERHPPIDEELSEYTTIGPREEVKLMAITSRIKQMEFGLSQVYKFLPPFPTRDGMYATKLVRCEADKLVKDLLNLTSTIKEQIKDTQSNIRNPHVTKDRLAKINENMDMMYSQLKSHHRIVIAVTAISNNEYRDYETFEEWHAGNVKTRKAEEQRVKEIEKMGGDIKSFEQWHKCGVLRKEYEKNRAEYIQEMSASIEKCKEVLTMNVSQEFMHFLEHG